MRTSLSSTLLNATTSIISPHSPTRPKSSLATLPGAPLSNDTSLVPSRYLSEKRDEDEGLPAIPSPRREPTGHTSSLNLHPNRSAPPSSNGTRPAPSINLVRAPPSQLLDAPARAALNMPNSANARGQARAVRRGEAKTPDYEIDVENGVVSDPRRRWEERTPLLAPTPLYAQGPGVSRSSSASSTRSNRGILRRIFIDRATTPSQHLTRPTFPPPSMSTYSPQPPSPLTISSKINLFINQAISVILSTFFLACIVIWALSAELARGFPKSVWRDRPRSFPWDDDRYWKKEGKKVSKDPSDYASQVGMEIEHQTVETEDGYFLNCVFFHCSPATTDESRLHKVIDPHATPRPDGRGKLSISSARPRDHSPCSGGFPVLVLHGLFQSSGSFVTSEDRSLAFWLAKNGGYQVYLGNTRGVFDMGHRSFSRNDPRFWGDYELSSIKVSLLINQTGPSASSLCMTFRHWSAMSAGKQAMTRFAPLCFRSSLSS